METIEYSVPDISCGHCVQAITGELNKLTGVESVDVNLETKAVVVKGSPLDDAALRAGIEEAGYQAK